MLKNTDLELLQRLADQAMEGVLISDSDGKIIYYNKAAASVAALDKAAVGADESAVFGKPSVLPLCRRQQGTAVLRKIAPNGVVLQVTAIPVSKENGDISFIVSFFQSQQAKEKEDKGETEDSILFTYKGSSMAHMMGLATKLAQIDSTVLISGESGTGKVMLGQYIHRNSNRRRGAFISLNCAAMPGELLEEEIFGVAGHGDEEEKIGMLAMAAGGTLFLDEIEALPMFIQTRLLYDLHEKRYHPVGGRKGIPIECRLITATDQNLQELVAAGEFREDLFYLIDVFDVSIPPIRERTMDIIPMVSYLMEQYNQRYGLHRRITDEAMEILEKYTWPGNIREMDNTIERLVVMAPEDVIDTFHLPDQIRFQVMAAAGEIKKSGSLEQALAEVEASVIRRTYAEYGSSYRVARALNISQSKANRLIRKYC